MTLGIEKQMNGFCVVLCQITFHINKYVEHPSITSDLLDKV